MEYEERATIIYELIDLLKANKLDEAQKDIIRDLVKKLDNRTEKQKERFLMFYNLKEGENKNNRLCDIAKFYNCSSACIRTSISRIRVGLIYTSEERIKIIEDILKEYHNKN